MGRLSVHQKSSKQAAAKAGRKKPVKVVYISNPMRVTTTAARFRGLVQMLTGRDSNVADMDHAANDPMVFDDDEALSADSPPGSGAAFDYGAGMAWRRDPSLQDWGVDPCKAEASSSSMPVFEMFDFDSFAPQMFESFQGLAQSAATALYYESPPVGGLWRLSEV